MESSRVDNRSTAERDGTPDKQLQGRWSCSVAEGSRRAAVRAGRNAGKQPSGGRTTLEQY